MEDNKQNRFFYCAPKMGNHLFNENKGIFYFYAKTSLEMCN